jgi:glycosyltransferase involved in cell wall biosynthesis
VRILYLSASGGLGGAESCLLTLFGGLRDRYPTWDLHLLTAESGPLVAKATALGVTVHLLPFPPIVARMGRHAKGNALRALVPAGLYSLALRKAVNRLRPEIVHSNGFKMHLLAAWTLRRRVLVCHMHDYLRPRRLARWVIAATLQRFQAIVTNSLSVAAGLTGLNLKSTRVLSIYNGIALERFDPEGPTVNLDELSQLPPAEPGTIRIGLVATFARWKGHKTFLNAVARLRENHPMRAYIIGGPIYQTESSQYSVAELQAEVKQLGIADKVGFTGFLVEPADALRSLDIVVHASTDPEPFGMVLLEAMACGRALVASRAGGAQEIFEDGVSALGHTPGDAESLAQTLERVIRDKKLRADLGRNGRESALARFSASKMAANFAQVYLEVADRTLPASSIPEATAA